MEKVEFAKDGDALKLTHPRMLVETCCTRQIEEVRTPNVR